LRDVAAVGGIHRKRKRKGRKVKVGEGRGGRGGRGRGGRDIPHNQSSPLFWKLINIFFSNRITPIQPPFE
jgi:hypothetical protein